jgi:hypothetical protein
MSGLWQPYTPKRNPLDSEGFATARKRWIVSVHDDYRNRRLGRYFSRNFVDKHLRFEPLPIGGHKEARQRARAGNIGLNARHRNGHPAEVNTLLFDVDLRTNQSQIQRLMKEIEARNLSGFYPKQDEPLGVIVSEDEYYLHTSAQGSRQAFSHGRLLYGVRSIENRFVVVHLDGVD